MHTHHDVTTIPMIVRHVNRQAEKNKQPFRIYELDCHIEEGMHDLKVLGLESQIHNGDMKQLIHIGLCACGLIVFSIMTVLKVIPLQF